MPCKLDGILHLKSNSTEGVYLPGYYPYPELLRVLYNIHTRTKNFCEFCTTFIPVPGTSVRSVRPCHNTRGTGTSFSYLPGTSGSSVRPCHNTRNFWKFCKTFIPVPGTSVSSVGRTRNFCGFCAPRATIYCTRGTGTACFAPVRNFCEFCTPVPHYPELL